MMRAHAALLALLLVVSASSLEFEDLSETDTLTDVEGLKQPDVGPKSGKTATHNDIGESEKYPGCVMTIATSHC